MIDVTRSQPAPTSLASKKSYGGEDVRERLRADFDGKCYLCELPGPTDIDHLHGKGDVVDGRGHLEHVWENLFPAHNASCNQRRGPVRLAVGSLLDPSAGQRVEARLVQHFETDSANLGDIRVNFAPVDPADQAAVNTSKELNRIHTDHERHARDIRQRIRGQWSEVQACINKLLFALRAADLDGTAIQRARLAGLLAPSAPCAGLIRAQMRRSFTHTQLEDLGIAQVLAA